MPDNPYESTEQPHGKKRPRSVVGVLGRLLLYGLIIAVVVALLLPAKRSAREAARRSSCLNNMKMILLGLQSYHDANGELPPAYTVDENGNRLHSWRALILPYIEGNRIAELIDYTKPWNDPTNAEARETIVPSYLCPSAPYEDEHLTTYMAVVGPEFLFSGPTSRAFVDVTDGLSNTIAVVEIGHEHAVHWMSPEDVDENFVLNTEGTMETGHSGIFIAGFLDGHVQAIELAMDCNELRKMLTIAGRELSDK